MIKTILIAPYPGLAEVAKKMVKPDQMQLDVVIGNLDEGVRIARKAEKEGYELIISRGGTAKLIEEAVSIPVVYIDITGYDMLRVLTLIRGINEGIALVGFQNISEGANTICNILEYDVKMVTIDSKEEVKNRLEELKIEGYTVVIGDVITVQVAEEVGLRGILITSGKESLKDAFEEGIRAYDFYQKVNSQYDYLRKVFNSLPLPFIIVDRNMNVVDKNNSFEKAELNILNSSKISQYVNCVFGSNQPLWIELIENNIAYELKIFLIDENQVGIMILLHKEKDKEDSILINHRISHTPIIGESHFSNRIRKTLGRYISSDESICINGEVGTGKFTIGKEIHFQRYGQEFPLIILEGTKLTLQELKDISYKLNNIKQGTLLIKNIDSISQDVQKSLLSTIEEHQQFKIISLTNATLEQLVNEGKFNSELYNQVSQYPLHVPPLKERKEDIKPFVNYFLTIFHTDEGNETLGMKKEAIEYMERYDWPGNLTQLKQTVYELAMGTGGNYIELFQVRELLDTLIKKENKINQIFTLTGTLEEMENQIIRMVLEEENNNQSRTAERLGINRGTLWRKLKS